MLPVLNWAHAGSWPEGAAPKAAPGLSVKAFARGLKHPRWLYVLPNGNVLVAEAASEPASSWNPRTIAQNWVQRRAGSIVENANRISILRDSDDDGVADEQTVFLEGLRQPFGMALLDGRLYVANTDGVTVFAYEEGAMRIEGPGRKILDLPAGGYNNHWTRNIVVSPDRRKLFVTVGSSSNVGEHGMAEEERRACILEIDPDGGNERLYASGLRNPVGLDFEPVTGAMWTAVNERKSSATATRS